MSQPNSSHFHAGKAARLAGRPCRITDGRISGNSRLEWHEGWNVQDAYMRGKPTAEVVTQNENFFADLRAELRGARP
ncbi:MAG: hypothetical protein K9N47_21180 [Prosthecobacter sp.]|uniref:hypothetical protein n=1 Tax=Prosthecobacter sp. TaxID=1965333 RepID=UPI002621E8D4|nr:hypothetical protein [Prosthecobacter sp.]MCF7788650.1 hypothetical protein [Prosthecobacter sp.]